MKTKRTKEEKKILNELSKQYLGALFEDKQYEGVFQILDCIKQPGYVYASNGVKMIKRKISEINIHRL